MFRFLREDVLREFGKATDGATFRTFECDCGCGVGIHFAKHDGLLWAVWEMNDVPSIHITRMTCVHEIGSYVDHIATMATGLTHEERGMLQMAMISAATGNAGEA